MMKAEPGWFAVYDNDLHRRITPVVAWGENGKPLAFDPSRGILWPAEKIAGFVEIYCEEESRTQRKRRHA